MPQYRERFIASWLAIVSTLEVVVPQAKHKDLWGAIHMTGSRDSVEPPKQRRGE